MLHKDIVQCTMHCMVCHYERYVHLEQRLIARGISNKIKISTNKFASLLLIERPSELAAITTNIVCL